MHNLLKSAVIAAVGLGMAGTANAATVVATYSPTGALTTPGVVYNTFNDRTLGSTTPTTSNGLTVAFTGGGAFVSGSVSEAYTAPVFSNGNGMAFGDANGPDGTTYVSTGIGSAVMTFSNSYAPTYFGLLIGSLDSYNSLTFNFADGTSQNVSGDALLALSGNNSNPYFNFTTTGSTLTRVSAISTQRSFEFDDVAFSGSVPEPASWGMMILGAGLVGVALRRRDRRAAAGITA